MNKIYFFILLLLITCFVTSCKKDSEGDSVEVDKLAADNSQSGKIYFAKTLARAIEKEPLLRRFIKDEALKMFDRDYDVFYKLISDKKLNDGQTFYEKLSKYADSKDSLDQAVEDLPLLTILVPELPNFDAKSWKEGEIPSVAVEPLNTVGDNIKAFYGNDGSFEVPDGLVPCFPILVVKENERVAISKGGNVYGKASSMNKMMALENIGDNSSLRSEKKVFLNKSNVSFSFVSEVFNGIGDKANSSIADNWTTLASDRGNGGGDRGGSNEPMPGDDGYVPPNFRNVSLAKAQHIVDAMGSSAEWPRDFIYYGIDPQNGKNDGVLNRNIIECITSLRFEDGPKGYTAITAPGDPIPVDNTKIRQQWTDGQYEFRVTVLINKKNGPGEQVEQIIYAKPSDLFEIYYDYTSPGRDQINCRVCPDRTYAQPRIGYAKIYQLKNPLKIDSWDLEQAAFGWKIHIIKFSNQTVVTEVRENTVEFASNFEISAQLGDKVKIGPKFGASAKTSNKQSYTIAKTIGPSVLGDANTYFDKSVWLSYSLYQGYEFFDESGKGVGPLIDMVKYQPYEVYTGAVYLTLEPRVDSLEP